MCKREGNLRLTDCVVLLKLSTNVNASEKKQLNEMSSCACVCVWAFLTHHKHTSVITSLHEEVNQLLLMSDSVPQNQTDMIHKHYDSVTQTTQPAWKVLFCCVLEHAGYDYLIRLEKPWSDGSKRTGSPCLTGSWAGRLEPNSAKLQRTGCAGLIQLLLCMRELRRLIDRH